MKFLGHTHGVFIHNNEEYTVHCSLRRKNSGGRCWVGYIVKNGVMFAWLGDNFEKVEDIYEKAKAEIGIERG